MSYGIELNTNFVDDSLELAMFGDDAWQLLLLRDVIRRRMEPGVATSSSSEEPRRSARLSSADCATARGGESQSSMDDSGN